MTPQNTEYQIPNQGQNSPDSLLSKDIVDKYFAKPDVVPSPISNEILYMRNLGDKISSLRQRAVQIETERANSRRSSIAASIASVVNKLLGMPPRQETSPNIKRDILVERESLIGGHIFGAADRGVTRRFFYDDTAQHQAWFFTETTPAGDGSLQYLTEMRYEIHDDGVLEVARLKDQSPQGYHYAWQRIEADDYNNLRISAEQYYSQISKQIYQSDYDLAA